MNPNPQYMPGLPGSTYHQGQRSLQAETAQAKYQGIRSANLNAIGRRDVPATVRAEFDAFVSPLDELVAVAWNLPACLGMPRYVTTITQAAGYAQQEQRTTTRQPVQADAAMRQAIADADQRRATVARNAEQAAQDAIRCALAAVSPSLPPVLSLQDQWRRESLVSLMESTPQPQRQQVAASIVQDAQRDRDQVTLALMLSDALALDWRRLPGLDVDQLRRDYVRQVVAASPSGVYGYGVPAVAAWLMLQDNGQQSIGALIDAATAFYDLQRAATVALMVG